MFSALKKLTSPKTENAVPLPNSSHQAMSQNLQRKFAKGVHYNMKIIIKGDRSTGKTCLFYRLQGKKFVEEYTPTEEIQVASIQWNYKNTDDVVKVEVWDIVDKGKKKKDQKLDVLKLSENDAPALDAEFINVYKGTHGVILVMDITKVWTFNYVQKEITKIPTDIPILILGNHCDMSHHRTIRSEDVPYFIESLQRPKGSAQIRYTEASMSNGFGLKYIHKFFCLPFLQLQRETLLCQLEINSREMNLTGDELDIYQHGPDADYNLFLESLSKRRRQAADSSGVTSSQSFSNLSTSHVPSIILGQGMPIDKSSSMQEIKSSSQAISKPSIPHKSPDKKPNAVSQVVTSVEEFIPDGGFLDKAFLEESNQGSPKMTEPVPESDSDGEVGDNPLVADYQDDVDPDDNPIPIEVFKAKKASTDEEPEKISAWMGKLNMSGGRQSPEGGEDNACADTTAVIEPKIEGKKKSKKKSSKEKDESSKSEKKKKKRKKSSTEAPSDLEIFLSSRDASYEAI